MNIIRCIILQPRMSVLFVVPFDKLAHEVPGLLHSAEPVWKGWHVFYGFEHGLAEGVVVRNARSAEAL
jgi:hypothetical protein